MSPWQPVVPVKTPAWGEVSNPTATVLDPLEPWGRRRSSLPRLDRPVSGLLDQRPPGWNVLLKILSSSLYLAFLVFLYTSSLSLFMPFTHIRTSSNHVTVTQLTVNKYEESNLFLRAVDQSKTRPAENYPKQSDKVLPGILLETKMRIFLVFQMVLLLEEMHLRANTWNMLWNVLLRFCNNRFFWPRQKFDSLSKTLTTSDEKITHCTLSRGVEC